MNGPGASSETTKVYKDPAHVRTIEITEAQYNKLKAFGDDPVAHGFSKHYADVRHNCVDFTWDALNHAGIQRKHSLDVNSIGGPSANCCQTSAFRWASSHRERTVIAPAQHPWRGQH